jgi:predicted 3-demethylubiquinone-9 3-methyltransferase (glyoxalase superfamily)
MSAPVGFRICLWFDGNAEEAVAHYTSIFKDSKIQRTSRYPDVGQETHGREPGSVMTIEFELRGQRFSALIPTYTLHIFSC